MSYRKKLIEVSLPIEELNKALAVENSKRQGKMSTIHPYWARRPQSSCRTLLWASLVDDPSGWPEIFKTDEEVRAERKRLHDILVELAQWDNMDDARTLYKAKYEIAFSIARQKGMDISEIPSPRNPEGMKTSHFFPWEHTAQIQKLNDWLEANGPAVHDPFVGGGSTPLESYRLGMKSVGTDLNPLSIMITKSTVEIPSRFPKRHLRELGNKAGRDAQISTDLQKYGERLLARSNETLEPMYPKFKVTEEVCKKDPHLQEYLGQELTVLAWIWARTFPTPNPAYKGAEVPTIRSQCISKKKGYHVDIETTGTEYEFRVKGPDFKPGDDQIDGTMTNTGARCLLSGTPIPFAYLREQAKAGRMGKRMMAIVLEGKRGRIYASPNQEQIDSSNVGKVTEKPTTSLPESALGISVQGYGLDEHWKLFEPRQLKAISTLYSTLETVRQDLYKELTEKRGWPEGKSYVEGGNEALAYSQAIMTLLAMTISKLSDLSCNLSRWEPKAEAVQQLFARQTVSMVWDFAESNILSNSRGSFHRALKSTSGYFDRYLESIQGSSVDIYNCDAASVNPEQDTMFFTDPPYYDNIGYADLSDFFYTWLCKYLRDIHGPVFRTILTPKKEELVATPKRNGTRDEAEQFFLEGMTSVISRLSKVGSTEYPISFYYAFKQQEAKNGMHSSKGWVTFLQSIIDSGLQVVRTFPSRTEHSTRMITMNKSGLSTNVILTCRKRDGGSTIRRRKFMSELKSTLIQSVEEMQQSAISPIDLAQAAIGPGISIYSKHDTIQNPDGSSMSVREALEIINRELAIIIEETDDSLDPESRVCLKWFETHGTSVRPYGDLDLLLRPMDASSKTILDTGCMISEKGKVMIAGIETFADSFTANQANAKGTPDWAHVHRLIRLLRVRSNEEAAIYMREIPTEQRDRVRALTYRLYQICDEKNMTEQANDYNILAISWGHVEERAATPVEYQQPTVFDFE